MEKQRKRVIDEAAGLWEDMKKPSLAYERDVRKGWKKRVIV